MNVENEMYGYTRDNWSHRNGNKRCKEKFKSHTRKAFNRFATEDSYTWNIVLFCASIITTSLKTNE
jgi:hypothetical protein